MDNQSNPMGLLAPFVAAITAALQEMITKAVDEALTARAGAANAAALLDDALDQRIRDIATSVVDGAIENHSEYGTHLGTDDIREVIGDYDFDDKIASALNGYDLGDKITDVINSGSFEFSA